MAKIAPPIVFPTHGVEFVNGFPDKYIQPVIDIFLGRYKQAFSKELELTCLPPNFCFTQIKEPFVGLIWFKKIKTNSSNPKSLKRNFIFPVSNIELDCSFLLSELESKLVTIGGEIYKINQKFFKKKFLNLYQNLYETAYYRYMLDKEQDPLKLRVVKFRADYNEKLIWRWQYGSAIFGIKVKNGNFLYSLKRL